MKKVFSFLVLLLVPYIAMTQCIVPPNGAVVKTTSYTALAADTGKLIVMNCSSACTLTLPSTPQSPVWQVWTSSIGTATATLSPNGLTLDGVAGSIPIPTGIGTGMMIMTDNANYFSLRGVTVAAGVNAQTGAGYTAVLNDFAKLVTLSNAGAQTFTLPATAPFNGWFVDVENTGAGTWTISRNALNIDGGTTNPALTTGQGTRIFSDGANYFTQRGVGGGGSGITTLPVQFSVSLPNATYVDPNTSQVFDTKTPFIQLLNTRRSSKIVANGAGQFTTDGDNATEAGGSTGSNLNAGASNPVQTDEDTGATIDTPAGVQGGAIHRTGRTHGMLVQMQGSIQSISNVRYATCLTDQTTSALQVAPGGGAGTDVAAGNYVCIYFSTTGTYTGLTDTTHFVCVTKDGTTQNAVASSISADTANHYFGLFEDITNSKWHFYIDNAEVCGSGLTANLPTSGTNLRVQRSILNLTASSIGVRTGWMQVVEDK